MESFRDIPVGLAEALFNEAPDAVLLVDSAGRIHAANAETLRLSGYGAEELTGRPIEVLVPPQQREGHAQRRQHAAANTVRRRMGEQGSKVVLLAKDGTEIPVEVSLSHVRDDGGAPWTMAVVRDIRERLALEEKIWRLANQDALTGVYSRTYFDEELIRLERGRRAPLGVLIADVDFMKVTNDTLGHGAGDLLLRAAGQALRSAVRSEDVVARIGGDEFAVLLPEADAAVVSKVLGRFRAAVGAYNSGKPPVDLRVSAGGAVADKPAALRDAMANADAAMYADKRSRLGVSSTRPDHGAGSAPPARTSTDTAVTPSVTLPGERSGAEG